MQRTPETAVSMDTAVSDFSSSGVRGGNLRAFRELVGTGLAASRFTENRDETEGYHKS